MRSNSINGDRRDFPVAPDSTYLCDGYADDDGFWVLGDRTAYKGFQPVLDPVATISEALRREPFPGIDLLTRGGYIHSVLRAWDVTFERDWARVLGAEQFLVKTENVIGFRFRAGGAGERE